MLHALVGALVLVGLATAAVSEARRHQWDALERLGWMFYALPLPLLQLLTAYGVFTVRMWGRVLALLLSILYVWVFPFGTLLAVYTWWFFYGETGRKLYNRSEPAEPSER